MLCIARAKGGTGKAPPGAIALSSSEFQGKDGTNPGAAAYPRDDVMLSPAELAARAAALGADGVGAVTAAASGPIVLGEDTDGGDDEIGPEDTTAQEPPPPIVAELVAACVRYIQGKYGVPLDFTSDTLSLVDQYARDARSELVALPQSIDLVGSSVGAYFGEVCRRAFGGRWQATGEPSAYRLCFSRVHLIMNPIGVGREAVLLAPEPLYHSHFHVEASMRAFVEERAGVLPKVDEEEYYLPSTRFDVLTIIVEAMRAKMVADMRGSARFTLSDYGF
jgi:hypothetical protein